MTTWPEGSQARDFTHSVRVRDGQNFYFAASMIGYFDDLADALRQEDVSDEQPAGVAVVHAMEIVGPPSERYV